MSWPSREKAIIFRGLSVLLNSGVHILTGLESLATANENPRVSQGLGRMAGRLSTGQPLHRAMEGEKGVFTALEVGMVKVGETSGSLHGILGRLADLGEKRDGLSRKMIAATVYPAFVLALCTVLLIFAPVFVFADLLSLLAELKTELPLPTRLYLGFSHLVTSPIFYVALVVGVAAFAYWARSLLSNRGRRLDLEEILFRLPGLGPMLRSAVAAEVSGAISTCYASGLPLLRAVQLGREVTWSAVMENRLETSHRMLQNGESLVSALRETGFFSPMSLTILMGGEQVGLVSEAMASVERATRRDTELALETMQKLAEPALLLFVGVVVGFIAIATLAPTLQVIEGL